MNEKSSAQRFLRLTEEEDRIISEVIQFHGKSFREMTIKFFTEDYKKIIKEGN